MDHGQLIELKLVENYMMLSTITKHHLLSLMLMKIHRQTGCEDKSAGHTRQLICTLTSFQQMLLSSVLHD